MKKQTVDRTQEKVKIARELGLHSWADMREIIDMKWKPVTEGEVRKKLNDGKLILLPFVMRSLNLSALVCFEITILVVSLTIDEIFRHASGPTIVTPIAFFFLSTIFIGVSIIGNSLGRIKAESMVFEEWKDDLPYGALCAVKEAKEKGFKIFEIYYPTVERVRIKADPVILGWKEVPTVGYHNRQRWGMAYEIFYWDDGKVYE